jgi:hypothetical protein
MVRVKWLVGAIGLSLLFLAGCGSLNSFSGLLGFQSSNGDVVIAGSAESVAQSAQDALGRLGLMAVINQRGEAIYVSGKTSKGARFTLVLTEDKAKDLRQTRVRLQWDDARDDELEVQLMATLTGQVAHGSAQR